MGGLPFTKVGLIIVNGDTAKQQLKPGRAESE